MKRLIFLLSLLLVSSGALAPVPALADSGHARIVRLSLVQGDVRYAHQFHKDSLEDVKAVWEPAPLNLPIREGYAVATDANGRAEVEFENGAMAFLSANTVLEFYDLSLDDGALVTRLILRQGSAIFYVHPAKLDFFSVTGGDFSVEANGRSRFRLDNYDDGSTVSVDQGTVAVLRKKETKSLEKGQSYSINVNGGETPVIARAPEDDDFDKWVSGRIDAVATATTYASQYVSSGNYSAGFADLYNYGSWCAIPGYGFGWQPYNVGFGWNPFSYGNWYNDPGLGWNFISFAPWGWLPYHYGGWVFSPTLGWVWVPSGFGYGGYGPVYYRPVTAVWVHSGGVNGLVPWHPLDTHGKTPLNLNQGVYPVHGNTIATTAIPSAGEKWSVMNRPSHQVFAGTSPQAPAPAPTRVSRTILAGNSGGRAVTLSRDSSIVYDPAQHRFVNNSDPARTSTNANAAKAEPGKLTPPSAAVGTKVKPPTPSAPRSNVPSVRASVPRPNIAPPSPPASHGSSAHSSGGGAVWGGASSAASAGSASSSHSSSSSGGSHSSGGHH